MRTAVITIAAGREHHLRRQREGLTRQPPHLHVVAVMDPEQTVEAVEGLRTVLVRVDVPDTGLPLAAARNAGAAAALADGAELLVFLDVDCIPEPTLLPRYTAAAIGRPHALLAGPVAYLPPGEHPLDGLTALAVPHPARPVPPDGAVVPEPRTELFWSLSFAVTANTWARTGGFHPGYTGYGAEDTDFALTAAAVGASLHWVGGALAHHQDHGPSGPTPSNAPSIVRNARLFHDRHGWWPMSGWLQQLHTDGLVRFDPQAGTLDETAGR